MANYYATTVSEGGKIKEGKKEELQAIIDKYQFIAYDDGDITVEIEGDTLCIYGYGAMSVYEKDDEDYEDECTDVFLEQVAQCIDGHMVIKEVGNEKCCYVNAYAWVLKDGKVESVSLEGAVQQLLGNK
jgi:hypothetical protein